MGKTFYEAKTPAEAIEIYYRGHDNVYGILKVHSISEIVLSMAGSLESKKVLEVGAGGGIYTGWLIEKGAEVTCVDSCTQILKGNAELHPQARCILADATVLKLKEKFDLIVAIDIIEHVERDLLFLENMNLHLKKEGLLIINTQNSFSLNYLIEGLPEYLRGNRHWKGWDPFHVRFYNVRSLRRKLLSSGFRPQKWFGNYHIPYLLTTKFCGEMLGNKLSHIIEILRLHYKFPFCIAGWGIGVVARKLKDIHEDV